MSFTFTHMPESHNQLNVNLSPLDLLISLIATLLFYWLYLHFIATLFLASPSRSLQNMVKWTLFYNCSGFHISYLISTFTRLLPSIPLYFLPRYSS